MTTAQDPGRSSPPVAHRRDIDGLRALAVLPIVLNHAGVRGFGGGYVGVDIFFVISGYLITGILVRDMRAGTYSLAEFYRRRVLRIFPALFAMIAIVSVIAFAVLLPSELVRYGRSVAATAVFGSNVLFYSEAGYFDTASHTKLLLHTWSLAVEEQFYILWPLLIAVIGVASVRRLQLVLGLVAGASLAASIWLVKTDMTAAFYLLPSRAWELAVGGLVALAPAPKRGVLVREGAAAAGLGAITFAVWRFYQPISFPGLTALVPCLGAAALIWAGPGTIMGRLLSVPPLVFVGLVSYSLYLWHWPVIVLSELWLFMPVTATTTIVQILLSLVLAVISWRYVETPFRLSARGISRRVALSGGGVAVATLCAAAWIMTANEGWSSRFPPQQVAIASVSDRDYERTFRRGSCFVVEATDVFDAGRCLPDTRDGRPRILLFGDSMAAQYWPGLSKHLDRFAVLQATIAGCRPNLYPADSVRRCEQFYRDFILRWIPAHRPELVVVSGNWQAMDLDLLPTTLAMFRRQRQPVLLIGPVPQYQASLPRLIVFAQRNNDPGLIGRSMVAATRDVDKRMAAIAARAHVPYVSQMDRLCPAAGSCRLFAGPGMPLQFDYGHLTNQGAILMAQRMLPDLDASLSAAR